MLYKHEAKIESNLSDVVQDEKHGYLSEIQQALAKTEEPDTEEMKKTTCILPLTAKDFQADAVDQSISQAPIKKLLTASAGIDSRFRSVDQAILNEYAYMRIRNTAIFCGSSPQFKDIFILTTPEEEVNIIILVPNTPGQITTETMHDNIQNGLRKLQEKERFEPPSTPSKKAAHERRVWLPQFKIGDRVALASDPNLINFKVPGEQKELYV